jgi:predicted ester cyclase
VPSLNWNKGDLVSYLEMYDEDVVLHGYGPEPIGKGFYAEMMESFPGSTVHLDELLEVDDRLIIRYTQARPHRGEFVGIEPTGRTVDMVGICMDRHADGHVVERYSVADMQTVFEQLGAWPAT